MDGLFDFVLGDDGVNEVEDDVALLAGHLIEYSEGLKEAHVSNHGRLHGLGVISDELIYCHLEEP